jgi:hypothetical protein
VCTASRLLEGRGTAAAVPIWIEPGFGEVDGGAFYIITSKKNLNLKLFVSPIIIYIFKPFCLGYIFL